MNVVTSLNLHALDIYLTSEKRVLSSQATPLSNGTIQKSVYAIVKEIWRVERGGVVVCFNCAFDPLARPYLKA